MRLIEDEALEQLEQEIRQLSFELSVAKMMLSKLSRHVPDEKLAEIAIEMNEFLRGVNDGKPERR